MRQLCERKGVRIIEAEACPEHIHMLVEKPPKMAVSSFMGYLKGKSSTMLYEQFGELKYKYRSREFWCRGYYEETAGKNAGRIQEYIKNQLKEDEMGEQLTIQPKGPFTGSNNLYATGRPYLHVYAPARNKGLCPHKQNPRLRRGMLLYGVFRRGKNPPVLPGKENRAELQERGRALCKPS